MTNLFRVHHLSYTKLKDTLRYGAGTLRKPDLGTSKRFPAANCRRHSECACYFSTAARLMNTQEVQRMISADVSTSVNAMRERLNDVLLGKQDRIELVLACLLAGGHLLLDDLPGLGKTTLAKAIATCFGASFARVQCTPDLLPTDITGFNLYNQKTREFEFHKGPVFSDILLADEINRTTPRTQSALFEAMAERQVTIDGQTRPLSPTFFVMATQNPIDSHGAYPLPEAQLDRFAMKLEIGYPDRQAQLAILKQSRRPAGYASEGGQIMSVETLAELQRQVADCRIAETLQEYLVSLCQYSREHESVMLGVSPRGMLIWQQVAKAWAILHEREFVIPDDIQAVATPVLSVRLVTRGQRVQQVIESIMGGISVPDYR